jgi:hypothetical protein
MATYMASSLDASSPQPLPRRAWPSLIGLGGLLLAPACQPPSATRPVAEKPTASKAAQKGEAKSSSSSPYVATDPEGRKSLDGIPYDVWFDDPLAVAANSAVVASPLPASADAKPPASAASEAEQRPAADGAPNWTDYITADCLQEETKKIRNQLKALLQTQAAYNENFEVIKAQGAVLAALAGIVGQWGESVSWKSNAAYVRDFGWELFDSAKGLGKPNYDKTRAAYENLESVFSGSIPAGAAEPEAVRPFPEVAPRYYLMKRMKQAFNALKLNITTEERLKSDRDEAEHEAMVLAVLTKVVSLKDYGSADEPEYQQFMQEILRECRAALTAVDDQEFSRFSEALNVIDKNCLNCHSQYKE